MLDEAFLSRLDAMSLRLKHPSAGGSGGLRRSKALGTSVEFSDFREYAIGDDLRRVDWNAYARFDKLFLKLFMEEQEARVHLIVDASASMAFGEPSKWETAARLAEVLSYLALIGGDTVVLFALQGEHALHTRPLKGRQSYMEAADFLRQIQPKGKTDFTAAIPRLPLSSGRGLTVFLSDFLCESGYESALSSLWYRKQEVMALQVLSERELEPVLEDAVELWDKETGKNLELMASYDVLKAYRRTVEEFLQQLRGFCLQRGMGHLLVQAEKELEKEILRDLARAGILA